jgi:hypothetical protein
MTSFKHIALLSLILFALASKLGDVAEGNVNIGTGNTILSTGNFVSGDGNIVAPLDSNIFGDDPFFSSSNLFDPVTILPNQPTTSPIYPGPIPIPSTTPTTTNATLTLANSNTAVS